MLVITGCHHSFWQQLHAFLVVIKLEYGAFDEKYKNSLM
jgi:hypothetical protein